MTINRRLEKMETKTNSDSIDYEKVEQLTALLRSLEGGEKVDLTKFPVDSETIELAALLQRLDTDTIEYQDTD